MTAVETEHVLVTPTSLLRKLGGFQGFTAEAGRYLPALLAPEAVSYRPRGQMERDPNFKQLIPYVIFRHRDGEGRDWVFAYRRGGGQGESRLHDKRSVGVGGHISVDDASAAQRGEQSPYEQGMQRELAEEVAIDTPYRASCAGLINDDMTEVGQVHLGVVHVFDVERPAVRPREPDLLDAGFYPVDSLLADMDQFETWSQICLRALFDRAAP